jgi:Icc-related predicted phosphoesterase
MKIIALPDLHQGGITYLDRISHELVEVDLILLAGDLTNRGTTADAAHVVQAVHNHNSSILTVPGNWDGSEVDAYLTQEGINLHGRCLVKDQLRFIGVGGSLYSQMKTPNEMSETDFMAYLEQAANNLPFDVLVCHHPPLNTRADKTWTNLHIGSTSIRSFIEKFQPAWCFTGHIHETMGVIDVIGRTQIINPGPLWEGHYAYAEIVKGQVKVLEIRGYTGARNL